MKSHSNFDRITQNVYQVIRANGGRLLMSQIASKYKEMFDKPLDFDGNPKYFVKMERLLLLNCKNDSQDVALYYAPQPAHKLVVSILKKNAKNSGTGMPINEFREQLEKRMGLSLDDCDLTDFLMRWRFLSVRENVDSTKSVLFTPHNGSTVFFGNLNELCTEEDIRKDLEKANQNWKHLPVRLKSGKGFSYAFVIHSFVVRKLVHTYKLHIPRNYHSDFPTRNDARRAVEIFDDKAAFKSTSVSADIEVVGQRKKPQDNSNVSTGFLSTVCDQRHVNNQTSHSINENSTDTLASSNKKLSRTKVTVYLGNLKNSVTKQQILNALAEIHPEWRIVTMRLNVRSGWSHAFVGLLLVVFCVSCELLKMHCSFLCVLLFYADRF
ncbi:hypothetical protein RFI_11894 [Reticulomyxa filosa]|uniref:RRM domain-containing protein n=1 Tax=Reticulomyxa filosa TaxID=46433 RepID=X6NIR5_RETFI|nr:hypothetical protein RFI_11894 [Reticulomyxa filosa]|eukprot:ETO25242.1 hypothetical protein RFI_11894 [Reticulomyxa filosa]